MFFSEFFVLIVYLIHSILLGFMMLTGVFVDVNIYVISHLYFLFLYH